MKLFAQQCKIDKVETKRVSKQKIYWSSEMSKVSIYCAIYFYFHTNNTNIFTNYSMTRRWSFSYCELDDKNLKKIVNI